MKKSIVNYKFAIIALIMILLQSAGAKASAPWRVNPGDFRYDMTLYVEVSFNTVGMDYSRYDIGVFCGDECRGVAERLQLPDGGDVLYLRARSNASDGETMTFRYYDEAEHSETPIDGVSFKFESNGRLGYPSDPFKVKIVRHFDVVVTASDGGSVDNEGGRIAEGTTLTLTATPAEGHRFEAWSDGSTDNPRQVEVNSNITLEALFAVNQYNLVYMVDNELYKSSSVDYGTDLVAEEAPAKEGHTFSGWDGLPATMPARDVTVSGHFTVNTYKAVFMLDGVELTTLDVKYGEAITAPEAPAKEGHTFAGWSEIPSTMPARDITIEGSYTVNSYKLTYEVDGTLYKEESVAYGSEIDAPVPAKEGHTFSGWEGLPATMPARDVTVSGRFTVNTYKAVFMLDGVELTTLEVKYGEAITAPEAPTKEGHTFAGWSEIPSTMPARDITIEGSYTVNSYKLTYEVDGTLYKEESVAYGSEIAAPVPAKEGHTFSGWEGLPATMPARDVTVSGRFTVNTYKAVFMLDGVELTTLEVKYGKAITAPEAPTKEGHTFAGWSEIPSTMPARDITIEGSYTVNSYKLTYEVDGTLYKEENVAYGSEIAAPVPAKEGHTFSGWEGLPATMPARDVTVSGHFTVNTYKVVFKLDGVELTTLEVKYGDAITAPEAPAREGHTFAGWSEIPSTMPARDITIEGSYTVNSYKLTYEVDGTLYKEESVAYGSEIDAPVPEKEGHTFSGWEGLPATMPAKDVTVSGHFTVNTYKAVFMLDGVELTTLEVKYGDAITAPEAPAREGHTFAGWSEIPSTMPARDITVEGSYTVNIYKLTYEVDGTLYKEESVAYGSEIDAPVPEKEGHTFSGWDGLPDTMPAKDVTVSGHFTVNTYKAVFMLDGVELTTLEVKYGDAITAPEAPAREGHTFAGWSEIPSTMPARDITIEGSYTVNIYKLTYEVDGTLYKEESVAYGSEIAAPVPEKEGHTFSGWDGLPDTMPAKDVTVSGHFTVNTYTLTLWIDGEIYSSTEIEYGAEVKVDDPEVADGRKFDGWQEEIPETMPANDVDIHGTTSPASALDAIFCDDNSRVTVYTTGGLLLYSDTEWTDIRDRLADGIYIINGKKYLVRR